MVVTSIAHTHPNDPRPRVEECPIEIPRWGDVLPGLEGLPEEVIEDLRRCSSEGRREFRQYAAYRAAYLWCQKEYQRTGDTLVSHSWTPRALCYLESRGLYGGGCQEPGAGTLRHPAFCDWMPTHQSMSGGAWDDALLRASNMEGCKWVFHIPREGTPTIALWNHEEILWEIPLGAVLAPWEEETVLRRIASGKEPILEEVEDGFALRGPTHYPQKLTWAVHSYLPRIGRRMAQLRKEVGDE